MRDSKRRDLWLQLVHREDEHCKLDVKHLVTGESMMSLSEGQVSRLCLQMEVNLKRVFVKLNYSFSL